MEKLQPIDRSVYDDERVLFERKVLHNQSLADDLELKRRYGHWALVLLAVQLLIMNGVFIAVGLKWLVFSDYALHLYLGGTLLEVFGIVLVVVRYLFRPSRPDDSDTRHQTGHTQHRIADETRSRAGDLEWLYRKAAQVRQEDTH